MAELPQPIADHLDEIRELCTKNHVLRLSFVEDPSSPVPNFIAETWNGILSRHGVTSPFHMTDFEAKQAQFRGWDEARRRALLA